VSLLHVLHQRHYVRKGDAALWAHLAAAARGANVVPAAVDLALAPATDCRPVRCPIAPAPAPAPTDATCRRGPCCRPRIPARSVVRRLRMGNQSGEVGEALAALVAYFPCARAPTANPTAPTGTPAQAYTAPSSSTAAFPTSTPAAAAAAGASTAVAAVGTAAGDCLPSPAACPPAAPANTEAVHRRGERRRPASVSPVPSLRLNAQPQFPRGSSRGPLPLRRRPDLRTPVRRGKAVLQAHLRG
jgi:hypothetical protein